MNIEPHLVASPAIKGQTNPQAKLSPEVEQLLTQLKVRLGDQFTAVVSKVTSVNADEQQLLLQTKTDAAPAAQKQNWQTLLSQPAVKLVTLTHKQVEFSAITDLPINKGQPLSVVVSARGLRLLIDTQQVSAAPLQLSATTGRLPSQDTALALQALGKNESTKQTNQSPPAHLNAAGMTFTSKNPPSGRAGEQSTVSTPQSLFGKPEAPVEGTTLARSAASIRAIAAAVASALPKAQPTSVLLDSNVKLVTLLQHVPGHALPPAIKPLLPLLNTLQQQTLELTSDRPLTPATIARAMSNNGTFHERNALRAISGSDETKALNENDIKALLIKTIEGLSQLSPAQADAGAKQAITNDAVARLWLGLVNGLGGKNEKLKMNVSTKENLLLLSQNLAQNSLAKIQLNQYRSLATTTNEAGQANQAIHLDIPLKWPDTYGNAYLQIFPPKEEEDTSASPDKSKRQKQRRWRIFMELDMGDDGNLAVEFTVADSNVDATFWAEKDNLRQRAAAQLQKLRSDLAGQGLNVTDLRCSKHPPPEQKMNINYALIDVQT